MLLNCGVGEDSWEALGLQGDPTSPFWRRAVLGFLWKDWCWSWNSSTLATSCEELTHCKSLWCWEGLGAGEGDDRGWDGWMASLTRWTWVWVNSGSWWWTGRPGMLRFMRSQRVRQDWSTELNWTEWYFYCRSALNTVSKVPSTLSQIPINFPHPSYSFFLLILPQVTHEKQRINIQQQQLDNGRLSSTYPTGLTGRTRIIYNLVLMLSC